MLQGPAAVLTLAFTDDFDRLVEAPVSRRVDGLEIIECAEDVVVPPWRERKTSEYRFDDFAGTVGTKEPMHQEELTTTALCGLYRPHFVSTVYFVEPQAFEHTDRRMNRSVGCTRMALAVPPAIGHLLREQVISKGIEPVVFVREVGEDGEHHPRDASFALACPSCPNAIVDTAVLLEPSVEKKRAGFSRLAVVGCQTEVAEHQHCVSG